MGIGSGIVIKNRASLGGTDIISIIINKYLSFNIGGIGMAINAIILTISAAFLFNVEMAMLTIVAIFVANKAVDAIQEGFNHRKTVIIVSDKYEEIAEELLKKVKRGITFIDGEGAYTRKGKKLIYMALTVMELARTREIVRRIDPAAFLSIIDTREVEGKGFNAKDTSIERSYLSWIKSYIDEHKEEIIRSVQEIVRIPSVEGPALPGKPFGEKVDEALQKHIGTG
jgi:uncharacterized membrane-anchored protein YitT (DUF2179 family)